MYLKEGTYHTRLFGGPSTNGMKEWDGPSRSWPTPHTNPLFLPPEDPSPVLLMLHDDMKRWISLRMSFMSSCLKLSAPGDRRNEVMQEKGGQSECG